DIQITVYPSEAQVREGREVVFDCRARIADNSFYPPTRWTKVGGPLPPHAYESSGRLTIKPVSLSDSGQYACVSTHEGRTVEARTTLHVQSYGPQEKQNLLPPSGQCMADERACANNECVKADYICDGEPDCRDRSDELNCPTMRQCEPNEFKCQNQRCVQKMWLCDGDDDCGDNSDERDCGVQSPGEMCKKTEFQCHDQRQCVPSSFHCDGTNDCRDGSDEVGCVQPTVVEPPETNKQVTQGSTFQLTCKAVAVPEAYINWRLNWGPVCEPPRCIQTSEGGYGTLTVHNAQPIDQGAYTCEAINVKGRVLATPDCIVRIVNIPAETTPPAPIAQRRCDPRGSVQPYADPSSICSCKSLVTGSTCSECYPGSFHLNEKSPQGCLKCFCFGITDNCRSSNMYRTQDRLMSAGSSEGVMLSDIEERDIARDVRFEFTRPGYITYSGQPIGTKYWRLPQRFLGDKVTSYGGKLEFEVEYNGGGSLSHQPMVVLKGNQIVLAHHVQNQEQVLRPGQPIKIGLETYETNFQQMNGAPASREDLMMVLADLDALLIRASHVDQQYSTSLGSVVWEIAVDRPTSDGLALEVEQCACPPGYVGSSCEDCAPGYERSGHGPYLGTCVPERPTQPQCIGPGISSPYPGPDGRCVCKTYAQGPNCDQCPPHSFYMAPTNPQGCIPCFCSGVTQQCQSSTLRRQTVEINYPRGDRDQLELTTSDIRRPYRPPTPAYLSGQAIEKIYDDDLQAIGQVLYWKLPAKFLGNKVTAYGGTLKYTFRFSGIGRPNQDPDVIIRGNDISLHYTHRQPLQPDRDNTVEVKFFENNWNRVDGQQGTREHLLMALADLSDILIKAAYMEDCSQSALVSVSLEYAEPYGRGATAYEVEQCQCPPGYIGTSCEDCAPGYSRTGGGLYLGLCERCECHGHATQCDKEYGFCIDCQHNTEGDHCERCKPGFIGDARRGTPYDCQPAATRPPCQCYNHSPRGCDSFSRCLLCEHNTEGMHCERCKKGFYGDATKGTPYDCTPCPCPGAADCYLDSQGQVACRNCPAGLSGRLCDKCAPGYTRSHKIAGRPCEPIGQVGVHERTYVPLAPPHEALRVRILEPKYQMVVEGANVQWICQIIAPMREHVRLEWTRVGHASLPITADAIYARDAVLSLKAVGLHDAGQYRCTATTVNSIAADDAILTIGVTPIGRPPQPIIDPEHLTVNEGEPASFRCWVPGIPDCQVTWHKERIGGALPHGVYQTGNALKIPKAQLHDAGNYLCTAVNDYGIGQSPVARLDVVRPVQRPRVDPVEQTVTEREPARFRCWVPDNSEAVLKWHRIGYQPLSSSVQEHQGVLQIPRATSHEAGQYVCTATDPRDRRPQDSEPVTLNIRPPEGTLYFFSFMFRYKYDIISAPLNPQVEPPEQTVNEGDPAQFRCWVPENAQAILRWSKQTGEPLPEGTLERDGFLRINNVKMSDAGAYTCTASDPRGGPGRAAPPAILNVKQPPLTPQVDPPSQTVDEGQQSSIRCWIPGNPRAQLKWMKHGRQPLPAHAEERGGVLTISRTRKSDEGHYVCTASDPHTGISAEAPPAYIGVRQPTKMAPQVDPIEQTAPEGSPFRIRCWVPGNPHAQFTWRRASAPINEDSTDDQGILTVNRAVLSDAGQYICTAEDPRTGETAEAPTATVHVTPPSKIPDVSEVERGPEVSPPEQTVSEGDPSSIRCWVEGDPDAHLSWRRADGGPLPFGATDIDGVLSFSSTLKSDEGDYICTYHPPDGRLPKDSSPSTLLVKTTGGPPRPVATPPVLTVKRGQPARFHCDAHSPTPAQIRWGYGDADSDLPEGVTQTVDDIVIDAADDSHEGEYVCSATNDFGSGVAEPVKLVVTEVEQPPTARVEPRVWNGKPGDRHQFKCIVAGIPTPTVTWSGPNNTPLPHDVTELDGNILDFSNGRTELNGDYTCTATNPVGEASDHGSVNIGPSLTVKTTPAGPRLILTAGEPLLVKCEAFGEPEPEVEWLHDPGPERGDLPDDYKPVTISEQFIRHPSIGLGNAGAYTCKGSSSHATATKNIYIEVVEPSRVATVSILGGSSQWFEQGEPAELICTATGSSLVDRLEWVKVDDQLPVDVEEHNEPGLLHFPNFKDSYAGEYECRGYRNNELIASSSVQVYSTTDATDDAKVEIEPPRVRVVAQGESIVLKCTVEGANNGENFEWALLRGGNIVRKLGSEATLHVKSADPSNDFGVYRCNVEDDNGVVIGSAYTAVSVGYSGQTNAQVVKFDEKSDASFTCPIYSVPGSKVEWSRVDGDLPRNALPNGNKIEIKDFDDTAAGMYMCKVTFDNEVVEGYVDAQIFVPDTIIQVLLDVSSESVNVGDRAWFDCKVTGDPSAVIMWSREGADELPENAQVTDGRLLFTAVTEDDAGVYKCRAKTKAGPLETRTVLNIGSAKRKRKHVRGRHALRSHRRQDATTAHWEKIDGELQSSANTRRGVLRLASISKEDEGRYQCTITTNRTTTKSIVELQVHDFVPVFLGKESLTFPPLTDEQMKSLNVVLTFNSTGEHAGVIFETARRPSVIGQDPMTSARLPNLEHRAHINEGVVIYEYDVGYGKESISSPNKIAPNMWNEVLLRNNENKASLQLNSGPIVEKTHGPLLWQEGVNGPLVVGGHVELKDRERTHDGFKGIISSIVLSGKPVNLGRAERPLHMRSYNACTHHLCQHSSRCRISNTLEGYECECPEEYTGKYCQIRSAFCKGENCNSGICVGSNSTWRCVCPLNATGLRCELGVDVKPFPLGFNKDTSFVAIPKPNNLDEFEVVLKLKPDDVNKEHMLLYMASDYNPDSKKHLSVSIVDGRIVYSYSNGEGQEHREELHSSPVEAGVEYTVVLNHTATTATLLVNEGEFEHQRQMKSFELGSDLFVGGIPPGLLIPSHIPTTSFKGCLTEIKIGGRQLDLNDSSLFSSGDISECSISTPSISLLTSTEAPTTVTTPTTEEVEHIYETEKDLEAPEPVLPTEDESGKERGRTWSLWKKTPLQRLLQNLKNCLLRTKHQGINFLPMHHVLGMNQVLRSNEVLLNKRQCELLDETCNITICANDVCGPYGTCVPFNTTYYECQCKLYYDGPRCDVFKPIERAAQFDGTAFLEISSDEFPHLTSEKDEVVELKFKTKEPDGVLFWQGQQPGTSVVGEDYFSVGLYDGVLHFSYELGGGAAHMISEQRVDDDKVHYIRLERQGRRGILKIDNEDEKRGLSSGILAMLNADGNVFIGGVPDVHRATGGLHHKNFVGCVADVALNGEILDLMGNAIDGKNVKPCDGWIAPRKPFKRQR
ncbi:hypothetical protein Angca_005905, partial [Angiostrongylus cantonensis]